MDEFRYTKYYTVYSCEGDIERKLKGNACFSYVFDNIEDYMYVKYKITLYKGVNYCRNSYLNNSCLFTKEQIRRHISLVKSLYPFHYRVTDKMTPDGYDGIEVLLELEDVPAMFHMYVLTWLRYTYEYPYNVILKDAYLLKTNPIFRFESISNLFNLVLSCNQLSSEIHQIPSDGVPILMSVSEIRKRIKEVSNLNDIYYILKAKDSFIPEMIGKFDEHDIEYWESGFKLREKIYIKNYKKIKNESIRSRKCNRLC